MTHPSDPVEVRRMISTKDTWMLPERFSAFSPTKSPRALATVTLLHSKRTPNILSFESDPSVFGAVASVHTAATPASGLMIVALGTPTISMPLGTRPVIDTTHPLERRYVP